MTRQPRTSDAALDASLGHGRCANCGYDLRGHIDLDRCSECGVNIEEGRRMAYERRTEWIVISGYALAVIGVLCIVAGFSLVVHVRLAPLGALVGIIGTIILGATIIVCIAARSRLRRSGRWVIYPPQALALAWFLIIAAYVGLVMWNNRDTTVYAPGFKRSLFNQVIPGMTQAEVEALVGQPFGIRQWADDENGYPVYASHQDSNGIWLHDLNTAAVETWTASYTKRGDKGWDYNVVYDKDRKVIRTRSGYDSH